MVLAKHVDREEAPERLRLRVEILDRIGDAVIATDNQGIVVYWGPGAERLYGVSAAEALGRPLAGAYRCRSMMESEERAAQLALELDGWWRGENLHVLRSGEERQVESTTSVLLDQAGQRAGLVAVIRDVTDRAHADRALRQAEERARRQAAELKVVLDTVPAAVWIARDPEGRCIEANRFGGELLACPPGANISITGPWGERPTHFRAMRDGLEIPPEHLPMQAAARDGIEIRDYDFDVAFEDGRVRHLLGNAAPLLDASGRPQGSVGAFIDVTERKEAERQLAAEAQRRAALHESERQARQEAERIAGLQSRLMGVVSHDLKSPLQTVLFTATLLLEHGTPTIEQAERLSRIAHAARRMEEIIRDLLDLERASPGKTPPRPG